MKRKVYVKTKEYHNEIKSIFTNLENPLSLLSEDTDFLIFLDNNFITYEPTEFQSIYEMVLYDFGFEILIFLEPYLEDDFIKENTIKNMLLKCKNKVLYFDDFIVEVILANDLILKNKIVYFIESRVDKELIESILGFIDSNLNSSKAASTLFMHRNTLNYRLDRFKEKTQIDVRTFKGANAIYMLYKY
ncbi:hypothetical protein CI105_04265 [Candidatus Izimaplasma bacterium ZiA1]|uniref:helix-turn-helix domain-containing protein n=1 Tax=Candidatus Izimoplasma sp. ZiA1 TaxID=2024899 RepID=UPI000BAA47DD|nr:hypothetical protein CI105_04265 [Candidatus Izimaplasma bacterium ZiA1]